MFACLVVCYTGYKAIGCFRSVKPSPLREIHNFRGHIDWNNIQGTVQACADESRAGTGFRVFGLEFFGECKASSDAESVYEILPRASGPEDCVMGVGTENFLFLYEFN